VRLDKRVIAVVAGALALCGCSSGSGNSFDPDGGAASKDGAGSAEGASTAEGGGEDASELDTGSPAEAGGGDAGAGTDAGSDASPCVGLGAPCKDSTTCYCAAGSGCAVDNMACSDAGVCALAYTFTSGSTCCETCELAYDQGGTQAQWSACNDACGVGGCPMRCFAQ
jgi:hypothetical protein